MKAEFALLLLAALGCAGCGDWLFGDDGDDVRIRWSKPIAAGDAAPLTYAAVGTGIVVFPLPEGARALDADDGSFEWTRDIGGPIPRNLIASGSRVFAATGSVAYALDQDGDIVWDEPLPADGSDGRSHVDDLHFYVPLANGIVRALRRGDGSTAWDADVAFDSAEATLVHGVQSDGAMVYAAVEGVFPLAVRRGAIVAISATSGDIAWAEELPAGPSGRSTVIDAPLLTAGLVIASDMHSNAVVALRAMDGSTAWRWQGEAGWVGPIRSPVEKDGIVYFGSGDTHVYARRAASGAEVWTRQLENSVVQVALCGDNLLVDRGTLEVLSRGAGSTIDTLLESGDEFVVGGFAAQDGVAYFASYDRLLAVACD